VEIRTKPALEPESTGVLTRRPLNSGKKFPGKGKKGGIAEEAGRKIIQEEKNE